MAEGAAAYRAAQSHHLWPTPPGVDAGGVESVIARQQASWPAAPQRVQAHDAHAVFCALDCRAHRLDVLRRHCDLLGSWLLHRSVRLENNDEAPDPEKQHDGHAEQSGAGWPIARQYPLHCEGEEHQQRDASTARDNASKCAQGMLQELAKKRPTGCTTGHRDRLPAAARCRIIVGNLDQ